MSKEQGELAATPLLLRSRCLRDVGSELTSYARCHDCGLFTGQAEGVTEPRPSSLPDNLIEDLAPKILLSDYAADTTQEIINDL